MRKICVENVGKIDTWPDVETLEDCLRKASTRSDESDEAISCFFNRSCNPYNIENIGQWFLIRGPQTVKRISTDH